MILRSGKIVKVITRNNPIRNFFDIYFKIKSKYSYDALHQIIVQKNVKNMTEICTLYLSFLLYGEKKLTKSDKEEIVEKLSNVSLIKLEKVEECDDICYICGSLDCGEWALKCLKNHTIHLECLYQKIISNAIPKDSNHSFTFTFYTDQSNCLHCDYCNSKININFLTKK